MCGWGRHPHFQFAEYVPTAGVGRHRPGDVFLDGAQLFAAADDGQLGQHLHGVHVEGGQAVVAAEDGQLGAAQNGAVTAHGGQSAVDLGKFLPAAPLPPFDLLVDDGHDQTLDSGLRRGGLQAEGGALLLIQAGADGAVGGKDGGAATKVRAVSRIMWRMGMPISCWMRSTK